MNVGYESYATLGRNAPQDRECVYQLVRYLPYKPYGPRYQLIREFDEQSDALASLSEQDEFIGRELGVIECWADDKEKRSTIRHVVWDEDLSRYEDA